MPDIALIAIQYLYEIKLSDLTNEEQRVVIKHAVNFTDDIWTVFANTKNVFGSI